MRWENLGLDANPSGTIPLFTDEVVTRTFDTPEFRGITFHEIRARSILNRMGGHGVPPGWSLNPYRGCSHACVYCFARSSHSYLGLDTGLDFDAQIVVKVNAAELLRRELSSSARRHRGIVAMGTNVDCYQRAEGRYRLMPGILACLRDYRVPFAILTKGSLILRDLDLLREAAQVTHVETAVSVGFTDQELWRAIEPGAPSPAKRLEVCRALNDNGIACAVIMSPVIPYLSDSPGQLRDTVRAIAESGAISIAPEVLYLRPGSREWFMAWLGERHPGLVPRYAALYGDGVNAPSWYQRRILGQVKALAEEYGVGPPRTFHAGLPPRWTAPDRPPDDGPTQLTLM